jgi:hemolysin III
MRAFVPPPMPVTDAPLVGVKPRHRGRLHQLAFFVSIPFSIALVAIAARGGASRLTALIYASSLTGLFASSATYNRLLGTPRLRSWMRWVDHAMIYVLIAGTYTPVCWVALPRRLSVPTLAVIWSAALAGVVMKLTRLKRFRRVGGVLYLAMGWASLAVLPELARRLSVSAIVLLAAGGALYCIGALILWLRRPNPTPDFGYHEVWHAFVVAAGGCHFAMVWLTLLRFR